MGTWTIITLILPQYNGDWDIFANFIRMDPNDGNTGFVQFQFGDTFIYLDGSPTPTSFDDLPEGFQIDNIQRFNGINTGDFEQCPSGALNFSSTFSIDTQGNWVLSPMGLTVASPDFVNFPNTYNGILQAFLTQLTLQCRITQLNDPINASARLTPTTIHGYSCLAALTGEYSIVPPPPNIDYFMFGGIGMGGSATLQLLTDASGIYTLTPDVYHDELYQRIGTTSSTTINVVIPDPHVKFALLGE